MSKYYVTFKGNRYSRYSHAQSTTMTRIATAARRLTSLVLTAVIALQPVLAAQTEYRIPLRDLRVLVPSGPVAGDGEVDVGDNPLAPELMFYPDVLNFEVGGDVRETRSSRLINTSKGPAALSSLNGSDNFDVSDNCPEILAPGSSCTVSLTPTELATEGIQHQVAVTAPGIQRPGLLIARTEPAPPLSPRLAVVEDVVYLGEVKPGEAATGSALVTNIGTAPAILGGITSSERFRITSDCPLTLDIGASCTISAKFSSLDDGMKYRTLQLTTKPNSPNFRRLTFFAKVIETPALRPALSFDAPSLIFPEPLDVGKSATGKAVLTNKGTAPAVLEPFLSTKTFTVSSDCPESIEINASCNVSVTFVAQKAGTTPFRTLRALAQNNVFTELGLQGYVKPGPGSMASQLVLDPLELAFVPTQLGTLVTLPAKLENVGETAVAIESVVVDQGPAQFARSHDCGSSLAGGASCTLSITFKPTVFDKTSGRTLITLGDGSEVSLPLSGTGEGAKLTVNPTVEMSTTVFPGTSAPLQVGVGNRGNNAMTGVAIVNNDSRLHVDAGDCTNTIEGNKGCFLLVSYTPESDGPYQTSFKLLSDNGGSEIVTVTGTSVSLVVSPPKLTFPSTGLRASAADQTISLSNTGQAPASLSGIGIVSGAAQFGQSNNCGKSLAAGASCDISVRYTPDAVGVHSGVIGVTSGVAMVARADVEGTGVDLNLVLSVSTLNFSDTNLGNSSVKSFTVSNPSTETVSITGISVVTGEEFAQSNYCGEYLHSGESCTVDVQMTPIKLGVRIDKLALVSSTGTYFVNFVGKGMSPYLEVGPETLTFEKTYVGLTTASKRVTVKNNTANDVPLTELSISTGEADFVQSNNCADILKKNSACTIDVQMTPSAAGVRSGSLSLVTAEKTYSVALQGEGKTPDLEVLPADVLSFNDTHVRKPSAIKTVLVKNNTATRVPLVGISVIDGTADFAQSNDCGDVLEKGTQCTVNVQMVPSAVGARAGALTVSSSLGDHTTGLVGQGITPELTLSPSTLSFGYSSVGKSVVRDIAVTNTTEKAVSITGLVIDNAALVQSTDCTSVIKGGASCTIHVKMTPKKLGDLEGNLTLRTPPGEYQVAMRGTGADAAADELPSDTGSNEIVHYALTFLDTEVGSSSAVRNVMFRNKGNGPLVVKGISQLDGFEDFRQSNDCGEVLAPGAYCTISLLFTPSDVGLRTGSILLTSDTATYQFDMSGKGGGAVGRLTADTSSDFGVTPTGTTRERSFTFRNTGTALATGVSTTLTGSGLAMVSNDCGTAGSTVIVAAGMACKIVVQYAPTKAGMLESATLTVAGGFVNGPVSLDLTGNTPAPSIAFKADPSGDFGTIAVKTARKQRFVLSNSGQVQVVLNGVPSTEGDGFSVTGGTCVDGLNLARAATCYVDVTVSYASVASLSGKLIALTAEGASTEMALSADVVQPAYTISGNAYSETTPTADFGERIQGDTRTPYPLTYYYLRDITGTATIVTGQVSLSNNADFRIAGMLSIPAKGYGTECSTSLCDAKAPGGIIRVAVQFKPTKAGVLTTVLKLEHNGIEKATEIELQGTSRFDAQAVWSTSVYGVASPTESFKDFGTITQGTRTQKLIYTRNPGNFGAQAVGFQLSGDIDQFAILSVKKGSTATKWSCNSGGVYSASTGSVSPCEADMSDDPAPMIEVQVEFRPTKIGDFRLTVTPTTNNGTLLPGPITFKGSAKLNPTGVWNVGTLNYGVFAIGKQSVRSWLMRNVGTHGPLSTGFVLTGDVDQFKLVLVNRSNGVTHLACNSGGRLTSPQSSIPCYADDKATGSLTQVRVEIMFAPTRRGTFSVVITPNTSNGTVLPEPITLTGTGQ